MKKIIILLYLVINTALLFAQTSDSLAYMEEIQRLKRVNDSIINSQLEKDSLSLDKILALKKAEENAGEETESEAEKKFNAVMLQQDKEQRLLRNKLLLAIGGFAILVITMRRVIKRQKNKKGKKL